MNTDLAELCAEHLRLEETLLAATVPTVRAIEEFFGGRGGGSLAESSARHAELDELARGMTERRARLRNQLAALMEVEPREATLSRAIARLPSATRATLEAAAGRVRGLVAELAKANQRMAIHAQIHVDAYQRLIHDLTGSSAGSGRYGPLGKPESPTYRPLLQIHG